MSKGNIYPSIIQSRGQPYRDDQVVTWSHYDDPIDRSAGRPAGNSRIWGDASPEAQSQVIDALIASSERAGLNPRETAYVLAIARVESGFNLDAAAGTTSATGLGQFIDKTGTSYGINDDNRSDLRMQADALVAHYQENAALARSRDRGEAYIYKYHHDGPTEEHGGLALSEREVIPYVNRYETFVREHEKNYGVTPRGPSLAKHESGVATHHSHHGNSHPNTLASTSLEQGSHGSAVTTLQTDLANLGYGQDQGQPLKADGDFGIRTRHAVERFQHEHHLAVDGKAGPLTQQAMHSALQSQVRQDALHPLDDPRNPDHTLYEQALAGVSKLDAQHGRKVDGLSHNIAAALVVEAKREGMTRIDQVALGDDNSKIFIAQRAGSPFEADKYGASDTIKAAQTPVAQSSDLAATIQPPIASPAPCIQPSAPSPAMVF
ncbi:peptidoglycan-binding protein [Rhodanobacter sp. 7MK24]|uniref:peptidoglycan-binding protein n=1 Tax=Rhodanobacter sp. 7MK24 TaxID=2775922 RepID=UPI0017809E5C|nr:peptidoglycan-binding protein [Rhodanobacter sp. 7MK24]MBD8879494.1 peptidoglycan-binding protein [Rhodanobacter sp. 7MK24]